MLACPAPDNLSDVSLPIWGSRKLDGIRCVIRDGVPKSRKLKKIPNVHITNKLTEMGLPNLDGELMLTDPKASFSEVTSAVMTRAGFPTFVYHVFDMELGIQTPYWIRYSALKKCVREKGAPLVLVPHWQMSTVEDIQDDEASVVAEGFEGLMLRGIHGPYKYGRSTKREGYLMKLKRFEDDEAKIVGFVELMRNENDLEVDDVGYAKRSTAKEGKVPAGTLGALVCTWRGVQFEIGTGFTAEDRDKLWKNRSFILGLLTKFKYQEVGSKGKPRFPVWLGSRDKIDV